MATDYLIVTVFIFAASLLAIWWGYRHRDVPSQPPPPPLDRQLWDGEAWETWDVPRDLEGSNRVGVEDDMSDFKPDLSEKLIACWLLTMAARQDSVEANHALTEAANQIITGFHRGYRN